jgi:hypothetical protein
VTIPTPEIHIGCRNRLPSHPDNSTFIPGIGPRICTGLWVLGISGAGPLTRNRIHQLIKSTIYPLEPMLSAPIYGHSSHLCLISNLEPISPHHGAPYASDIARGLRQKHG